ncbi:MarR family winged helix-turn-helix transcriptional regulator [Nocardia xishanensis]|uniref:MarR family winged helix-turn-helix transcriptional regulator n=1 Tax=Nocardia xishanensis TaxID=238964 RepID=UPI003437565B
MGFCGRGHYGTSIEWKPRVRTPCRTVVRCKDGQVTDRLEPEAPSTLYLIKQLELAVRALMDDALRPLGLTTLQYTALTVLERRSRLSSAQLARRSFLRPQTMNVMVQTMEERGLINRHRDPANRRVLVATLTDHGREVLREAGPLVAAIEGKLLEGLSPRRRAEFRTALARGTATLAAEAGARDSGEMSTD